MSNKADGSDLLQDKSFLKQIENMEKDYEDALNQWESQADNRQFKDFPSDFLSQYKSDGKDLTKAARRFSGEFSKVIGRRGDAKELLSAFDDYSTSLKLMHESNARFKALIDVQLAKTAVVAVALYWGFAKFGVEKRINRELKEVKQLIEKAEEEVSDTKLKRNLNLALSAVTLMLAPEAEIARVAVAAGSITSHVIIDHSLGKSSTKATVVTVAGDGPVAIEKLSEASKKFAGAAAAIITCKFDSDEVHESQEIVEKLRKRLEVATKKFEEYTADASKFVPKLKEALAVIKQGMDDVNKALTRSAKCQENYDDIKKTIKKALKP